MDPSERHATNGFAVNAFVLGMTTSATVHHAPIVRPAVPLRSDFSGYRGYRSDSVTVLAISLWLFYTPHPVWLYTCKAAYLRGGLT